MVIKERLMDYTIDDLTDSMPKDAVLLKINHDSYHYFDSLTKTVIGISIDKFMKGTFNVEVLKDNPKLFPEERTLCWWWR